MLAGHIGAGHLGDRLMHDHLHLLGIVSILAASTILMSSLNNAAALRLAESSSKEWEYDSAEGMTGSSTGAAVAQSWDMEGGG